MLKKTAVFFLMAALLLACHCALADTCEVSYTVTFAQSGCRDMLQLINDFRTGSENWCWDENDENKIWPSEPLEPLAYDYDLEKIAMQRAAECALYYGHTRPDNTSCFTAFTLDDLWADGENIAAGYNSYVTPEQVFIAWREDEDNYSGQGHRRNMLSPDFNCIGVGHAVIGNLHFWAQSLGYRDNVNTAATAANNQLTVVYAVISSDLLKECTVDSLPVASLSMEYGESAQLPGVTARIRTFNQAADSLRSPDEVTLRLSWISDDPACVEIDGVQASGKAVGQAMLTASAFGQSFSLPASVTCASLLTPDFVLPGDLTVIEAESFYNIKATAVEIPASVTAIGSKAFAACSSLRQITIPAGVVQIANDAFDGCRSGLVICCQRGSKAEAVALKNSLSIIYLQ